MSKPIEITINVDKIDKSRITSRTYTNRDGEEVTVREYKMAVVPSKERKFVTEGDGWKLFKTHFVAEKRGRDEERNYLGDGFQFEREEVDEAQKTFDEMTSDDSPF